MLRAGHYNAAARHDHRIAHLSEGKVKGIDWPYGDRHVPASVP